jgi:diguanylate cyclase (GGDEF)-like protein
MSVIGKTAVVALVSFAVTMVVIAVVSRLPGMDVPLGWWIIGGILPVVIAAPAAFVLARQSEAISQLNAQLVIAYAAVKRAAETDHLTGISNRAAFDARAAALHGQRPGWFLVIDIDHFKTINDNNGHAHGDIALIAVAEALRGAVGPDDLIGRLGGEEFGVFLPGAGAATALATAEDIRRSVAALTFAGADGAPLRLTVSIGVTGGANLSVANGLSAADRAMYRAKQAGRDQVHFAE